MDYEILIRFLLAALWGGIVGAEREYHNKSAGFRTMIMISAGSCFFTIISMLIGGTSNPDRIAANVVTGIGFLGAGVIFRGDNKVNGITTAASIWAVAAIGMGIGAGFYWASGLASLLILVVLAILPYLEQQLDRLNKARLYTLEYAVSSPTEAGYRPALHSCRLRYTIVRQVKEENKYSISFSARGPARCHDQFIKLMLEDKQLKRFEY